MKEEGIGRVRRRRMTDAGGHAKDLQEEEVKEYVLYVHKTLQETQQEGVKENEPLRVRNPAHSGWGIMHTKVKKVKQFSDRIKS